MNTTARSRDLADGLRPGTHTLHNDFLRAHFGLSRITAKARADIAHALQRAGLEVLSDPDREPLVVRKTARASTRARPGQVPWWRRRWAVGLAAVLLLLMLAGALGDNDPAVRGGDPPPSADAAADPAPAFEDAVAAVDASQYRRAIGMADALEAGQQDRIARKISRHLAMRARAALRRGSRSTARRLLRRAAAYPATAEAADARDMLEAADDRAAYLAEQRRLRRAAARQAARERAAAERAAAERVAADLAAAEEAAAAESYDAPDVDGGSTANWCGKRDGDGDGIYCEE